MPGTKNKLLIWLVVVLLIANAATIALFWVNRSKQHPPAPKGSPRDFLVNQLKMDAKQTAQFDELVKQHRANAEQLREKTKEAKEAFFNLLKQVTITDSAKQTAAKAVSANTEALDILTLEHFQKVRAICTPDQQKKFDEIIGEVVKMMGQPRPPMGPGPGPHRDGPNGEGPPPQP